MSFTQRPSLCVLYQWLLFGLLGKLGTCVGGIHVVSGQCFHGHKVKVAAQLNDGMMMDRLPDNTLYQISFLVDCMDCIRLAACCRATYRACSGRIDRMRSNLDAKEDEWRRSASDKCPVVVFANDRDHYGWYVQVHRENSVDEIISKHLVAVAEKEEQKIKLYIQCGMATQEQVDLYMREFGRKVPRNVIDKVEWMSFDDDTIDFLPTRISIYQTHKLRDAHLSLFPNLRFVSLHSIKHVSKEALCNLTRLEGMILSRLFCSDDEGCHLHKDTDFIRCVTVLGLEGRLRCVTIGHPNISMFQRALWQGCRGAMRVMRLRSATCPNAH